MNFKKSINLLLIQLLLFTVCSDQPATNPFVRVAGTRFTIQGKPYYFLGTNLWYGANLGALTEGGNRARLVKELDLLKSLGINNLRVAGASEGSQQNTVQPAFQPEPGQFDENVLQGLDFLLHEMRQRQMYAVVYLNNYWEWSGGMAQYRAWSEQVPVPNPNLPQYTWDQFMNFSAGFYASAAANQNFRNYIKMLLNRKNTFSGIIYKDDPTIMSWQLANEPRPGWGEPGQQNFKTFSRWIDETAKYIKSLDQNHLVSTGNEGLKGSLESAELYPEIHQYNSVDYLTFHLWLLNWNWFDPQRPAETYPAAEKNAIEYINQHIDFAAKIGKPTVIEEFGMPRDLHAYSPTATVKWRDQYFETVFQRIFENAAAGGPLVGSNFWAWGGYGKTRDPEVPLWKSGDDFIGDPPQEPQGRNSVFAADTSTLKILGKYAKLMREIK